VQISIGQRVHHFEIQERLGEGGMGVVFKVKDLKLGRSLALKVLKSGPMDNAARE
jgi:eukaryotic-like serine/threonine-protein kinase